MIQPILMDNFLSNLECHREDSNQNYKINFAIVILPAPLKLTNSEISYQNLGF